MRVELRAEASHDLVEGALFYDCQRKGLGDYFLECLFADLDQLVVQAGIHAFEYGYHCKLAGRFPFAIFYHCEQTFVDVVAILDCRRDPRAVARRLHQDE